MQIAQHNKKAAAWPRTRGWVRLFCALLAACLLAVSVPFAASAASMGDIDGDGNINASDALMALQSSVGLRELTAEEFDRADVDGVSGVNASDALLILQYSVNLIDGFPADTGAVPVPWSPENEAILQTSAAFDLEGAHTISQVATDYTQEYDLRADSIMLYIQSIGSAQSMIDSWKDSGRDLSVMIAAGRDGYNEYFTLYPERGNKDVHTNQDGSLKLHSGTSYYMLPTRYYAQYKLDLVKTVCEYEPTYLCIEEPEVFVYATYAEGFQEEWVDYYDEPWQGPLSSSEARYKTSKLINQLWVNYFQAVRDYLDENHPEIKLLMAAHDVLNYDHHQIVSCINTLTQSGIIDGLIGQTWSDCIYGAGSAYGGGYPRRLFERAWIEYASYADSMQQGQELFTLSDPKADNEELDWDTYESLWKLTVTTQLLMPELNRFQSYIWPHRAFSSDVPSAYKTKQLNVFNAMAEVGGNAVNLYAGTSGISLAMSDTLTYQYGSQYMPIDNTQDGIHSLSLPIIERGIPLKVTALDTVRTAADLEGIEVLILTYDIMKPVSEEINRAIADWVEAGGTLLYVGGHDAAESIEGEWWSTRGQTPLENLLAQLGLDVEVGALSMPTMLTWEGSDCESFNDQAVMPVMANYTATFTGEGITPLLTDIDDNILGFEARVGEGAAVVLGLPSSYFASNEVGPENLRELARYTVNKHSGTRWVESDLMVAQRGRYLAAQALDYTDSETLSGSFIDLYDDQLGILQEKRLAPGESALLYDLTELLTPGTPRFGFTGGELTGEVTESAASTSFSIRGPADSISSTRLLGNGKYPASIEVTCGGERYPKYTAEWDNATSSLLLQVENSTAVAVDITVEWGDQPVEDTPPYEWVSQTIVTNNQGADTGYILRDDSTASRTMRRVSGDGELVYRFDLAQMDDPYLEVTVAGNYLLEASADDAAYQEIARSEGEPVESIANRVTLRLYPDEIGADETLYLRLRSKDATLEYGAAILDFTLYQKQEKATS